MSHLHQRTEKDCLNCGTIVAGRYCQNCGQENLHPKESVWHLIVHFFNDVTHFDGKLFSTLKYLITKPGFLTREYMKGRRAAYLNPIRMYLFISAVFFLLLMTFFVPKEGHIEARPKPEIREDSTEVSQNLQLASEKLNIKLITDTPSSKKDKELIVLKNNDTFTRWQMEHYLPKTIESFDSIQSLLPKEERLTGFSRYFTRKMVGVNDYSRKNKEHTKAKLWANFFHTLPYMLFFSLPLIALIFKLLYIRRKEYYYVSHGIFVIHYFCVLFLGILLILILNNAGTWADIPVTIMHIVLVVYLFLAMKNFYKQGWLKTFAKFLLLNMLGSFFFVILFLILLFNSLMNLV